MTKSKWSEDIVCTHADDEGVKVFHVFSPALPEFLHEPAVVSIAFMEWNADSVWVHTLTSGDKDDVWMSFQKLLCLCHSFIRKYTVLPLWKSQGDDFIAKFWPVWDRSVHKWQFSFQPCSFSRDSWLGNPQFLSYLSVAVLCIFTNSDKSSKSTGLILTRAFTSPVSIFKRSNNLERGWFLAR